MNSGKGSMVLLTIIAVATLLVAVAGATFAYFGVTINGGESSTTIEVTSGTLSIEYNGDSKVTGGYVNQGEVVATKEFTITGVVTGSNNLNYEATLVINNNTYQQDELVYTISSTNEANNGTIIPSSQTVVGIPTGANTISLGTGIFAGPTTAGLTHKYVLTVTRQGAADQSLDKSFDAKLFVTQSKK